MSISKQQALDAFDALVKKKIALANLHNIAYDLPPGLKPEYMSDDIREAAEVVRSYIEGSQ
jgi:hypothetical protein